MGSLKRARFNCNKIFCFLCTSVVRIFRFHGNRNRLCHINDALYQQLAKNMLDICYSCHVLILISSFTSIFLAVVVRRMHIFTLVFTWTCLTGFTR